jgi:prepilin peptidase CpaA
MDGLLLGVCLFAALSDLKTRKVPNALTYPAAAAGVLLNGVVSPGGLGWGTALLGLLVGFGPFFAGYLLGAVGGGDAKLAGAVGAFLGPRDAAFALLYACVVGAVLALAILLATEGWRGLLSRLAVGRRDGSIEGARRLRLPLAVAILLGTTWALAETHLGRTVWDLLFPASAGGFA